MPKAVKPEVTIELTCSLCPKTPNFSDISHLLTHISSKSHLSHRFKLQIRAQSEPEAKEKLDTFDYWYHDNNLDALLAERLAAKENKKSVKERKQRVSNASTNSVTTVSTSAQSLFNVITNWFFHRRRVTPRRNRRWNKSLLKKCSLPHLSSEPRSLECTFGTPMPPARHHSEIGSKTTCTQPLR
jgi:hypothetical protein